MRYEGGQYYVKSPEEMASLFPYAREAIENTHKIAMRCHVDIEFGHYKLPKYAIAGRLRFMGISAEVCTGTGPL